MKTSKYLEMDITRHTRVIHRLTMNCFIIIILQNYSPLQNGEGYHIHGLEDCILQMSVLPKLDSKYYIRPIKILRAFKFFDRYYWTDTIIFTKKLIYNASRRKYRRESSQHWSR